MTLLTPSQHWMLRLSAHNTVDGNGLHVELRGSSSWKTAQALERKGLGWIQPGSARPGLFFANPAGVAAVAERDEVR